MKYQLVIAALLACSSDAAKIQKFDDDPDEFEIDKHEGAEMNYDEILAYSNDMVKDKPIRKA